MDRGRGAAAAIAVCAMAALGAAAPVEPLDPLQQAVVDSLAFPVRTTPREFLDAAIRAADVDALDVALGYVGRLVDAVDKAGDQRIALLADLGDTGDTAALGRLERKLRPREPAIGTVIAAIRAAAGARRRDPARLAAAARDLASPDASIRTAAAGRLAAAREDALPALVEVLQSDAPTPAPALARGLVRDLGAAARQPLLEWLASDDVAHWPGIIAALAASGAQDIEEFLLAPAVVADTPPEAQAAAASLLQALAAAQGDGPASPVPSSAPEAVARLAARLDRTLSPAGLPAVDHLRLEPVTDPREAAAAFGGLVTGSVERFVWNPQAQRFDRLNLPPRAARVQEAMHLARDVMALAPRDPAAVRLALLARLEATLVFAGDPATALDRIEPGRLRDAVSPPGGFSAAAAAEVLDLAVTHGMWEAAAAAARAFEPEGAAAAVLPPAARQALVRALAVPDAAVQFAAARALALAAGPPPYAGSSRVVDILAHAATATGVDRAVVAHHRVDVAQELATQVSRFGYEPVVVADGREAVFAARESADTVLVVLGARTARPTVLETVQFLQQQGLDGVAPVLVMVDPLDDDGRGCFLERLTLRLANLDGVAIVDSLDSFLGDAVDPPPAAPRPPRFPDALAQVAGPAAVDPVARATRAARRLARGREALGLLAHLGRRGWDVSAAARSARTALDVEALRAPAVSLLATIGAAEAQQALRREAEEPSRPAAARRVALASLRASVNRYGLLFERRDLLDAYARYNRAGDAGVRASAEAVLDLIERPCRDTPAPPVDAPPARSTR
ncbi:MAG: hypothetical protein ACKOC4_00185 [Planctomycetia bacterium]